MLKIFEKNIKIIYTFVATSRAKKIAYDVGRDSLPLTIDQDVPYIPLGTYFDARACVRARNGVIHLSVFSGPLMELGRARLWTTSSTKSLSVPLLLLLISLLRLLLCRGYFSSTVSVDMDGLPRTISPDLSKNELIRNLTHLQTSVLLQHRSALFQEVCNLSLVCPEFVHFPLVNRDTAIKSASHKLSEDIFTIISCIRNKESIPKTLFKNGKRSKDFLSQISQASQGSQPLTPGEQNNEPSTNSDLTSTTRVSHTPPPIESTVNTATSSDSVAVFFISRELNLLKEEIGSLKADLATSLHSRREMDNSMTNTISNELMSVKQELTTLRETVSLLSSRSDCNNCSDIHPSQHSDFPSRPHSSPPATRNHSMTDSASTLTIKTWNCRGYKNAIPYLSSLLEDNTDTIALSEHWLWPFELPELSSLYPDNTSIGQADIRLHEESSLNRGCGGVGIIWKKSLPASPIPLD